MLQLVKRKAVVNTSFEMEEISVKATGIVRRIDDLGRVVIPKEIRRTLRIREADPLLTTLTEHEKACETADSKQAREDLFVNGIVEFATRLGL